MQSLAQPGVAMYGAPGAPLPPAQMPAPAALTPASQDLVPVPPEERAAASEYDAFLARLTFNSKEIITDLTKIAGENANNVNGIAFVVERRILNAPPSGKLSYLYLLDCIVKNIGGVYVGRFAQNLYNVFLNVFAVSPPATRAALQRLLNTWPPIFGRELVNALQHAANPQMHIPVPVPPPMHRPVSQAPMQGRVPRIPLSRPAPKTSNHPGRSRSIVQVPIPKRQSSVQVNTSGMGMPMAARSMPQSVSTSTAAPVQGMNGMFGMHSSQEMQQMGQPGLHGGQAVPHQGMQGYGMQGVPQVYGIQQQMAQQVPSHKGNASNYGGVVTPRARVQTERMNETQRMMAELSRKTASGIRLTSEEYAGINSFITVQLHSVPSHSERELLIALQQQLRASTAASSVASQQQASLSHAQSGAMRTQPHHASYPVPSQPTVAPALNSDALSNLMRSLPDLARSAQAVQHQQAQSGPPMHAGHHVMRSQAPMPFSAIRTTSHTSFVRNIYVDLPHLSKSDGMRFGKKEDLRGHLDWLFARNRRKRAREQNMTSAGVSRCWFDTLPVFLGEESVVPGGAPPSTTGAGKGGGPEAEKVDPLDACVEARGDNEICPACFEAFESFWDDEKQAWMLKEALRNKHGRAYHTRCAATIPNLDEHEVIDGPAAGGEDNAKYTSGPGQLQIPTKLETTVKEEACAPNSASKLPAIPRSAVPADDAKQGGAGGDGDAQNAGGPATGVKDEASVGEMKMRSAPVALVKKETKLTGPVEDKEAEDRVVVHSIAASRKRSSVVLDNRDLIEATNASTVTADARASKRAKAEDSGSLESSRKRSSAESELPLSAESEVTGDEVTGDERSYKRLKTPDDGEETSVDDTTELAPVGGEDGEANVDAVRRE